MKKVTIINLALIFVLCFPAYAYLDPGTGSYFLQIIVATLLGAMYAIKQFLYKRKNTSCPLKACEIISSI